jgi:hypothetical protein
MDILSTLTIIILLIIIISGMSCIFDVLKQIRDKKDKHAN